MSSPQTTPVPVVRRRRRRVWASIGAFAVAAIAFVLFYFEPQAAFIDDTVDEALPGLEVAPASSTSIPATTSATAADAVALPDPTLPDVSVPAVSVPDVSVPDVSVLAPANSLGASLQRAQETGQPVIVSSAAFVSGEHDTDGTALVVALPDGSLVVRFEDLDTSNGPDLRVVLSPEPASESWQYDDRLHLGELKGNIGDQNYVIGDNVDLSGYRSVVIWCERFSVAFGAASIDVTI